MIMKVVELVKLFVMELVMEGEYEENEDEEKEKEKEEEEKEEEYGVNGAWSSAGMV